MMVILEVMMVRVDDQEVRPVIHISEDGPVCNLHPHPAAVWTDRIG